MTDPLRLAVFGGSFDPIHEGHIEVARRAERVFGIERMLWIPAARPPHKLGVELTEGSLRLAMILIATADRRAWDVSTVELERDGPSFTYDTLLEVPDRIRHHLMPRKDGGVAKRRRELELYMIIGSDNLPGLPGWRNAEDVIAMARPIVAWRDGDPDEHLAALEGRLSEAAITRLREGFMKLPPLPQSSTMIRTSLARGEVAEHALGREVLEFIVEKGLYRWPSSVELPPAEPSEAGDSTASGGPGRAPGEPIP